MPDRHPEHEAEEALERVRRDSESLGSSSLARVARRASNHFAGRDAGSEGKSGEIDPIEVWGRRIGRALSVLLALALTWWLGLQLGWWQVP